MSLLTYSGIAAKVKAMQSRLLSDEQFQELAALEDVRSAADYLKQKPAYAEIFSDLDDTKLHRASIEQLLTLSEYRDFSKLYRFANQSQRRFLDLCFIHYEVNILKRIVRRLFGGGEPMDLSPFQGFFTRHASVDLVRLNGARDASEFVDALKGSAYYSLLADLPTQEGASLFDYEMRLDLYYFKLIWAKKDKVLSKEEREILSQCFGSRLDLLNIQWIYRSKKYYAMSTADIYALLIPVHYRLRAEQVRRMVEAETLDAFFSALGQTRYGSLSAAELNAVPDPEALYYQILHQIYQKTSRRNPYSIAILDSYLYFKELEMRKIITTIEGIRYGLDTNAIIALAAKQ